MTPGSRVDPRQLSARNNSFSLGQDGGRTTHAALSVVGARQDGPRRRPPRRPPSRQAATYNTVVTDFIHTMPLLSFCLPSEDFTWKPSIVMLTNKLRWTLEVRLGGTAQSVHAGTVLPTLHSNNIPVDNINTYVNVQLHFKLFTQFIFR